MPEWTRVTSDTPNLHPNCYDCAARHPLREMWGRDVHAQYILVCEDCYQKRKEIEQAEAKKRSS